VPRPVVLCIAGNDSAGLAGLSSDMRTIQALGAHVLSIVSCATAQNSQAVISFNPIAERVFKDQLIAVNHLLYSAIKIGLVASASQISVITETLSNKNVTVVYDPVLGSSSGFDFVNEIMLMQIIEELLPLVDLLTPNLVEAEILSGYKIDSLEDIERAAKKIRQLGVKAVLIKGGHIPDRFLQDDSLKGQSIDYYLSQSQSFWLCSDAIDTHNTRGTGCVLSASISSAIALGYALGDAVVIGKMTLNQGLRQSYAICDAEKGTLSVTHFPDDPRDLPRLVDDLAILTQPLSFPECAQTPLGLYPVVDCSTWLTRLLPLGVSTIQLRVKDMDTDDLENEIKQAVEIANRYDCRLFINDHWELAIKHKAYGIHLGQEDLATADLSAIHTAGLRLGLSSHCHYEVARAYSIKPSYIACGPIYHTTSKDMPWIPQGITGLQYWLKVLDYPLVAIGGVNTPRFVRLSETNVSGIAMISAITQAQQPEAVVSHLMTLLE